MYVAELNCIVVPEGVPVAVAVAVALGATVDVDVGVALGELQAPSELKTSENALTEPVSIAALSLMLITHVPFAFCPSNALNGLFGENDPVGNALFVCVPVVLHWLSTVGSPPSSFSTICARLLLLHPTVETGTPGLSYADTVVPPGDVIFTIMSPTHEWLMPGVVDAGSALCTPSKLKLRSDIVPTPLTGTLIVIPAAALSGIATAGPV